MTGGMITRKEGRKAKKYHYLSELLIFLLCAIGTILLALVLLAGCTLLPQQKIDKHVLASADTLLLEGPYPRFHDFTPESQLDNYTDSIMLEEARGTTRTNLRSIFTNPRHEYPDSSSPLEALAIYAKEDADSPASWFYTRYWMGFRVLLRLWLVFFTYVEIRRYLSVAFFLLLFLNVLLVSKYTSRQTAFLFALSVILVRPNTIASSMQFSCCFFIVFFAMLFVPYICRHTELECLFFFELGMITQFFDFYTTPLLTFGYPMVYLYLLHSQQGARLSGKKIFKAAILWLIGYVFMWLAKLALTTWFTDVNGFNDGINKFFIRIGITKDQRFLNEYSPLVALHNVFFLALMPDKKSRLVAAAVIVVLAVVFVYLLHTKRLAPAALRANRTLIILAFLPLVWFAIAAQPSALHYTFQYRSIALTYWALGAWIASSFTGKALTPGKCISDSN